MLELLRAELDALGDDLRSSGLQLRRAVILLLVAVFFGFWTVGVLAYAAVEVLSFWLPRWGAVLTCLGGLLLLTLLFLLLGRAGLRRLESPARTVARRIESHSAWLREEVLPADPDAE